MSKEYPVVKKISLKPDKSSDKIPARLNALVTAFIALVFSVSAFLISYFISQDNNNKPKLNWNGGWEIFSSILTILNAVAIPLIYFFLFLIFYNNPKHRFFFLPFCMLVFHMCIYLYLSTDLKNINTGIDKHFATSATLSGLLLLSACINILCSNPKKQPK